MSGGWEITLGPPGTGKTTDLLQTVLNKIRAGVDPRKIAVLSFTKKATEEIRDRAIQELKFSESDCVWWRTLHSLAFNRIGLRRSEVMGIKNYKEIGNALGLTFASTSDVEEGMPSGAFRGDRYIFLDGFARVRKLTPEQAWRECAGDGDEELNFFEFQRFRDTLKAYKRDRGLFDFTDMLEIRQQPLDVRVVIVDEAQDLSTLQWEYLEKVVAANAEEVYVAGDDDQAIFQWSGADVFKFQSLPGTRKVLSQSKRVPISVHSVAQRIASGIAKRCPKKYFPTDNPGEVHYYLDPESVDLSQSGTWLLLARNIYQLPNLAALARAQGHTYSIKGKSAVNPRHTRAMLYYERWLKGATLDDETKELITELAGPEPWPKSVWHEALRNIPKADREWYLSIRRRGGSLFEPPRIRIDTIHGVKGGEADNVMLLTDMTSRTMSAAQANPDSEARVWYTGVTRTKNSLNIVLPQTGMGYDL